MTRTLQILAVVSLMLMSLSASAFRSLKVESYSDPDFKTFLFKKTVILVQNASNDSRSQIEERLVKDFKDHGVEAMSYRSLFPPTRTWTPEDTNAVLTREQVNAVVIVTVGASAERVNEIGTTGFMSLESKRWC